MNNNYAIIRRTLTAVVRSKRFAFNFFLTRIQKSTMQSSQPEAVLISYSTFKSNLPKEFIRNREQRISKDNVALPDRAQVTIISDKEEFSNTTKTTIVNSFVELESFRKQILERPLLLFVTCGKHVPHGQRLNKRGEYLTFRDPEWWIKSHSAPWGSPYTRWGSQHVTSLYEERYIRPEFVVSVNTAHPNIRRLLEQGFGKAEDMLQERTNFAVEFNFNPMILQWWKKQGIKRYDSIECLEITVATGASFVLTNCSPLNHFFDCHPAWCAFWPCYLLLAVPYKVWRNDIQGIRDIPVTMEGNAVTASPSLPGYSLMDLHQSSICSSQPSYGGWAPAAAPMTNGIPAHTFFPPPILQGPLGNPHMRPR